MVSNIIFISENNEYLAVSHSLAGFSLFRLTALIQSEVPSLKQSGNLLVCHNIAKDSVRIEYIVK